MSDPIRSISQNNFLLADQKEVSHDNTLSGNGTEASPLGLNETVLWESQNGFSTSTTEVNLSEDCRNFEIIAVYWNHQGVTTEIQYYKTISGTNAQWLHVSGRAAGDGNVFLFVASWTQTSATRFQKTWCFYRGLGPSTNTNGNSTNELVPVRVVGINRIANN